MIVIKRERERLGLMSTPAERERDEGDPPAGRGRDCDKRRGTGRLGAEGWIEADNGGESARLEGFCLFCFGSGTR